MGVNCSKNIFEDIEKFYKFVGDVRVITVQKKKRMKLYYRCNKNEKEILEKGFKVILKRAKAINIPRNIKT